MCIHGNVYTCHDVCDYHDYVTYVCVCHKPQVDSEAKLVATGFSFKTQAVIDDQTSDSFRMEPPWNMGFFPLKKH